MRLEVLQWISEAVYGSWFLAVSCASPFSCVHVGDHEWRSAAVLLAGEQGCDKPAGAGRPSAQTRAVPADPLLPHGPLLGLQPRRETQLRRARVQAEVRHRCPGRQRRKGLSVWTIKRVISMHFRAQSKTLTLTQNRAFIKNKLLKWLILYLRKLPTVHINVTYRLIRNSSLKTKLWSWHTVIGH